MLFFFRTPNLALEPRAMIRLFGPRDENLWEESCNTLWACSEQGDEGMRIVDVAQIESLVSMQKLPALDGEAEDRWFVVEKYALAISPS